MDENSEHNFGSWGDWDTYRHVYDDFERDVNVLIRWPLDSAIRELNAEVAHVMAPLEAELANASPDQKELIFDEQERISEHLPDQERFLRNQALVSLISLLTFSLFRMMRDTDHWAPMVKKKRPAEDKTADGKSSKDKQEGSDEFKKIWRDLKDRCGVDLNAKYIGFVDSYRRARNRIVHQGGYANPYRPFSEIDPKAGVNGLFDFSFSNKCKQFVQGESFSARVSVSDALLEKAIKQSSQLLEHLAGQLRAKELESGRKSHRQNRPH